MPRTSTRSALLTEYAALMGVLTDSEIARRVGCSQEYVSLVRRSRDIAPVAADVAAARGRERRKAATQKRLEAHPGWHDPAVSDGTIMRDCRASAHTVQRLRPVTYAPAVVAAKHPRWHDPSMSNATIVAESGVSRGVVKARRPKRPGRLGKLVPLLVLLMDASRTYGELSEILGARVQHLLRAARKAGLIERPQWGLYAITAEGARHAKTPQAP